MNRSISIAVFLLVILAVAISVGINNRQTPAAHDSFAMGDCAVCHEDAPKFHIESQWVLTHGRSPVAVENRCVSCHSPQSCTGCHSLAPASHTANFRNPESNTHEAERHVVFGRARPSSCLVCHRSLATECTSCHRLEEINPWAERGRDELLRWKSLLGEF